MLKYFVISKSRLMADAIARAVKARYFLNGASPVFSFSYESPEEAKKEPLELFHLIFDDIEKEILSGDLVHDRFIGIMDFPEIVESETTNAAETIHVFTSVQGMLMLAFPEIQWIPLYRDGVLWSGFEEEGVMTLDRAVTLCSGGYSPLFDGDGLRSVLIERAHAGKYNPEHLNYSRTDVAFAIDEEHNFAALTAYTAYRFGYRAFPVTSKAAMEELLGKSSDGSPVRAIPLARGMRRQQEPYMVAFEDVFLEFPDANQEFNENNIAFGEKRAEHFPMLTTVDLCVFTTAADADEKVFERRKSIADFFKSVHRHKHLSEKRTFSQTLREYLNRFSFNLMGGYWWGYWVINLLEFVTASFLLLFSFLYWPTGFFPLFLLIFIVLGPLRQQLHFLVQKKLHFIPWLVKLNRLREQWVFMPKCYENHYPVAFGSGVKYWEISQKPLPGIFGLRNKCQLPNGRNYNLLFRSGDIRRQYRDVRRPLRSRDVIPSTGNGHAAPGVSLELATLLLHRAEHMKERIIDAEGAIHAAVLASVAVELLNYKSPSVSIEAFKWKHYYEVLAECEFVGVRANLDMKERYIDIHNGMARICRSEATGQIRDAVFLSAMAEMFEHLVSLLDSKGKVGEAAYFRIHSRRLHRKLMSPLGRSILAYPEWVLRSKWHFITSFGVLCIGFLAYCIWQKFLTNGVPPWDNCWHLLYRVVIARDDLPGELATNQHFIFLLARQIAALHLGFVAAYFLMFMNRK